MRRRVITAVVLAIAGSSVVKPSFAADRPAPAPPAELLPRERPTRKEFYGWEVLVTGEVGALVASASVLLPDKPLEALPSTVGFLIGMPVYALGGPITHWRHGEFEKGLIAFGGNAAFPLIGGLVGKSLRCGQEGAPVDCGVRGFFTGLGVAVLVAPVVDAFVLGWQNVPLDDSITALRLDRDKRESLTLVPIWTLGPSGSVEFGVAGRF